MTLVTVMKWLEESGFQNVDEGDGFVQFEKAETVIRIGWDFELYRSEAQEVSIFWGNPATESHVPKDIIHLPITMEQFFQVIKRLQNQKHSIITQLPKRRRTFGMPTHLRSLLQDHTRILGGAH